MGTEPKQTQEKRAVVGRITNLRDHPNAQNLQIAEVCGHTVCVGRHYHEGQFGFHIPDGALIPDKLADEMWVKGKLAGNQKNRVKSRDMKGVFSDGLFYGSQGASWNADWQEGDDVTEQVGITFRDAT